MAALFGLPLKSEALDIYRRHTGRQTAPGDVAREAWLIVGRRGGKSRVAALIATYLGCFRDYSKILAPGERATVMVIACDRSQARVVFRYIAGMIETVPMLANMVEGTTAESIELSNRVSIEVHTASFRAVRGYSIAAAILDEVAFWRTDDSANPDVEIVNAIRPGLASVPGSMLLGISSPYARRGVLWDAYRKHHGKDGDPVFVWQADTRSMNPTIDEGVIAAAYAEDEASAAAEYGALFRRDIESFITREVVEAAVVPGRHELPPILSAHYVGFIDPSGGSQDSMTLAIAHHEARDEKAKDDPGMMVLDAIRERKPPFSPEDVVREFVELLKTTAVRLKFRENAGNPCGERV